MPPWLNGIVIRFVPTRSGVNWNADPSTRLAKLAIFRRSTLGPKVISSVAAPQSERLPGSIRTAPITGPAKGKFERFVTSDIVKTIGSGIELVGTVRV